MSGRGTIRVNISLNDSEHAYIKMRAEANNMTVSEYLKFCSMYEAVTAGDRTALAVIGQRLTAHTKALVRNWVVAFKKGGGKWGLKIPEVKTGKK